MNAGDTGGLLWRPEVSLPDEAACHRNTPDDDDGLDWLSDDSMLEEFLDLENLGRHRDVIPPCPQVTTCPYLPKIWTC